jgi:hypothetical protein
MARRDMIRIPATPPSIPPIISVRCDDDSPVEEVEGEELGEGDVVWPNGDEADLDAEEAGEEVSVDAEEVGEGEVVWLNSNVANVDAGEVEKEEVVWLNDVVAIVDGDVLPDVVID